MKHAKRIGAGLMALAMAACFTGCKPASPASDSPSENTSGDTGELDLKGYTFTLVSAYIHSYMGENPTRQEVMFFKRKEAAEKKYGCTIKIKNLYCEQSVLLPKILAGDKVGDVVEMMPSMWIPAISSNCIVPWDGVEGMDVYDENRWVQAYTNASVINGKCYGVQYATPPEVRTCVIYNKSLLAANGFTDDLATLVDNGEWTFSKFRDLCRLVTKDKDMDGNADTYGLLNWQTGLTAYALCAANNGGLIREQNGKVSSILNSQQNVYALNFLDDLVNVDKAVKVWDNMKAESTWNSMPSDMEIIDEFRSGNAGFIIIDSWAVNQYLKGKVSFDYGLVPLPKGPDAENYVSPAQNIRVFCLTSTAQKSGDLAKTVAIFNALADPVEGYEGTDWWTEDIQAEYFQDNDQSSIRMYTLCLNSSAVDLGHGVPDMYGGLEWAGNSSIYWKNSTPAAQLESIANNYGASISSVFKFLN